MKTSNKVLYKLWQLFVIILLNILIIAIAAAPTADALSKMGSTGSEDRQIQTKLKNWGYYNYTVDGIYGTRTKNAVISFQKKNGLSVDGIAGPKTLAAMGISSSSSSSGQ